MIYKLSNPNPNRKNTYFEGHQYKNLSSMTKFHGKFDRLPRPDGVFININRQQLKTPDPSRYTLATQFSDKKKSN